MKKNLIFLIALMVFLLQEAEAVYYGPYTLTAPFAIDGDTIRADVNIWPGITVDASIRVLGVDTPELHAANACERDLAIKAKAFTDAWILANQPIMIGGVKTDKFSGRYDSVVLGNGGINLATELIKANLGRPYNGGPRSGWCQ